MEFPLSPTSPAYRGLHGVHVDGTPLQPFWQVPQRSEEWFAARHHRITGSVVPRLMGMFCRSYRKRYDSPSAFRDELAETRDSCYRVMAGLDESGPGDLSEFQVARMQFGVDNEDTALHILHRHRGHPPMASVGLLIDPVRPWRGCSVDALFEDGFAEAKCSIHARPYTDCKPYHRVQMAWNAAVIREAMGDAAVQEVWFVGYAKRGSVVRRMQIDRLDTLDIEREMWVAIREYVLDFCPSQGVPVPDWLSKCVY